MCVPGGWLAPRGNYTDSGDMWRYYHGHCLISTRKEFVLLPSICGLLILVLAIVALWQSWPARCCGFSLPGPTTPRASPVQGLRGDNGRQTQVPGEHMPLLVDNDPGNSVRAQQAAAGLHGQLHPTSQESPIPQTRRQRSNAADVPGGTSFEEQYGSWCQRSGHMVQGGVPHSG
ncbi:hypothetical protein GGF43_002181 [Coemansia sp. RSA 2618]|nr:hypothetical protein GGF43_002181 [Coemansia sp. RSA 2618]